jgi:hypothetical protein
MSSVTTLKVKRYIPRPGFYRLSQEKAQTYGAHLDKLSNNDWGRLTAEDVVEDATNSRSPLHSYFNWDDKAAAHLHRLEQARYLLRSISVEVVRGKEVMEVRSFEVITDKDKKQQGYTPITSIMKNKGEMKQILERAGAEMEQWISRYEDYKFLSKAVLRARRILQELK